MNKNFITIHIVRDLPWSNTNRDDTGTPKRTILGGVERGLLSSQSIKRAIRKDYESRILTVSPESGVVVLPGTDNQISAAASLRTRNVDEYVLGRAKEILASQGRADAFDEKKAEKFVEKILKKLFGDGKDVLSFFSVEELEQFSNAVAHNLSGEEISEEDMLDTVVPSQRTTGALAIAAFGRMFANLPERQTDAAIAVSPAISTHANLIETDYWIGGEDYALEEQGAGAGHIGTSLFTSGIFYHSVTIDIAELHSNWTGFSGESAEKSLKQLIRSIVRSLPTGKKNSTAPYTEPTLVIAEQQGYREAYSIEEPVQMRDEGGFAEPTVELFARQFAVAREVSPENYGSALVSGTRGQRFSDHQVSEDELISGVVSWIIEGNGASAGGTEV